MHQWEAVHLWSLLVLAGFPLSTGRLKCTKLTQIVFHMHEFQPPTKGLSSGWSLPGFPHFLFWISGQEAEAIHYQTGTEVTHDSGTLSVGPLPCPFAHQPKQVSAWNGGSQEDNITRCRVQSEQRTVFLPPCVAMWLQMFPKGFVVERQRCLQTDTFSHDAQNCTLRRCVLTQQGSDQSQPLPSFGNSMAWELREEVGGERLWPEHRNCVLCLKE